MPWVALHLARPAFILGAMKNALRILAAAVMLLPLGAMAEKPSAPVPEPKPLEVKASDPELKRVQGAIMALLKAAMPCLQAQSKDSHHEKASKEEKEELQGRCMCENQAAIANVADTLESVLKKRPAWRGRSLRFKEGDGASVLRLQDPKEIRKRLKACAKQ